MAYPSVGHSPSNLPELSTNRSPVLTGLDVRADVQGAPDLVNLPVVMHTASGEPENLLWSSELNTTDDVMKAQAFPAFVTQVSGVLQPDRSSRLRLVVPGSGHHRAGHL
ncbi:hypothetical protein [uncultured Deinococcus sp.]|uniref:hypothetical protein n=1 Tax=uncultured Deinococcus sp. TaxID=158789 RepID=UPI0025DA506E|nr:hypothetical protein [uncultured Deinococcus sp.]